MIAARSIGRRFLGIELDPKFHEVATRRMELYTQRLGEYVDFEREAANASSMEAAA